MDLIHRDSYIYNSKVTRTYLFDNNDGRLDYEFVIDLFIKHGIQIEGIYMAEFGDMYDEKAHFQFPSYELFKAMRIVYHDIVIENVRIRGRLMGHTFECGIHLPGNEMTFICSLVLDHLCKNSDKNFYEDICGEIGRHPC